MSVGFFFLYLCKTSVTRQVKFTRTFNKIFFPVMFFLILCQSVTAKAQTEDCYQPVHPPTIEEKRNFIEQISKLAVEAEKKYGVPAPVITGMAILESGYGLTPLSMGSNNIYGYKKVGGRESFTLKCQPSWDQGNEYVKFNNYAEAVDLTAKNLKTSKYYRTDTAKYQSDVASGVDRKTAALTWLIGISDPYNYDPPNYVINVRKIVNNPYNWSEQINADTNFWKLAPTNESPKDNSQKITQVEQIYNDLIVVRRGRYMESSKCDDVSSSGNAALNQILKPYFDYLSDKKLPFKIQDCTYSNIGLTGRVIMLNVDANQLARWTVNACQPDVTDNCLNGVIHNMWLASGAQFPITGTVTEEATKKATATSPSDCEQGGSVSALYAFRDGVTVRVKSFRPKDNKGASCFTDQLSQNQREAVLTEPVLSTGSMMRISNTSERKISDIEYLKTARNSYLEALGIDEYKALKSWTVANRRTNQFTRLKNVPLGVINNNCWYAKNALKVKKYCP